ncbi:hypothetical protein C3B64_17945 [Clostridium botulinum]|uniref:Uncharacterized protein n=1 Tax=Clostridium botulinum TaxID=1491 RepID=A0AAU8Z273_CLOBO|nr:hypothetical protein [Clostridium sporogenes]AVP66021.1 hypothetical protein C3B64_17945 [Clostridium botulinum]
MKNLLQENKNLKEKLRIIEEDQDELKLALHIVTVHCCHLIGEKEGKKVEDIYKEINKRITALLDNRCAQ